MPLCVGEVEQGAIPNVGGKGRGYRRATARNDGGGGFIGIDIFRQAGGINTNAVFLIRRQGGSPHCPASRYGRRADSESGCLLPPEQRQWQTDRPAAERA